LPKEFSQNQIDQVVQYIMHDDLAGFSAFAEEYPDVFHLSFGRFPILSFCYLYEAKSIAKKHHGEFIKTTYYIKADEPCDAYLKFKKLAGVHLRSYVGDKSVTPAEMLALTRETDYLKQNFKKLAPSQTACENILSVCMRRNQYAKIDYRGLKIAPASYKQKQRIIFTSVAAAALLFVTLFAALLGTVFSNIGFGTEDNPFSISNAAQLQMAAGTNSHYILTNDIILPDGFTLDSFGATLDGQGFTVYSSGLRPIIYSMEGKIHNLNISVQNDALLSPSENFAFVAIHNRGILRNISLTLDARLSVINSNVNWVGGAVLSNAREINNLSVSGTLSVTSRHTGNMFVGGIAAHNTDTRTGFGVILLTVLDNSYSSLNISLYAPNAAANASLCLGGVAGRNDGLIRRSAQSGSLTVTHASGVSDTGAIAGHNEIGTLYNNGAFGILRAAVSGDAAAYLGGIVGWLHMGHIEDNFSLSDIAGGYNIFVGGIVGAAQGTVHGSLYPVRQLHWDFHSGLRHDNNVYLTREPYTLRGMGQIYAPAIVNGQIQWFEEIFDDRIEIDGEDVYLFFGRTEAQIRALNIFWVRDTAA